MQASGEAPAVPAAVERFAKQLVITHKAVTLYPPASSIPRENATEAVELLEAILVDAPEMRLVVNKDGLVYGESEVFAGRAAFTAFAQELYARGVADVRFHAGVTPEALITFLGMLKTPPDDLARSGGFATRLWDAGVDAITVTEAVTRVVDVEELGHDEELEEGWPPTRERLDEILARRSTSPRDRRILIKALRDTELLSRYLLESFDEGEASTSESRHAAVLRLARAADDQPGELRSTALQSLAEAIMSMPPGERRSLLAEDMLREVRVDDAIAAVIRQMGVDDVCRALVEDDGTAVSVEGVARALRNLSFISLANREEVLNASGAAMREAGMPEETVVAVLDIVSPSQLRVREHAGQEEESRQVESILRLMDVAPSMSTSLRTDPSIAPLQEEGRAGISDGDVVSALVVLASFDVGSEDFDESLRALEDGLSLLIERGEYVVAADAAESLLTAVGEASEQERDRISAAVGRMATAESMRAVHRALQMYEKGTPEHEACRRLLATLGMSAIDPLLEVLADEPDMSGRKSLVDLISSIASDRVDELGKRLTDPRWYFVRNVVSILGATRKPEIVPYLGRTLRHSDARVRRETIRALANVPDVMSSELIVGALEDPDAQNVQLAARYLGSLRVRGAASALIRVAQGEGRGNREHAPRAEAIEALGIMGATEAVPVLQEIAGRRRLIGGARAKGLKSVAESAIAAIQAHGRAEGGR